jgi:hypothetical protein
VIRVNYQSGEPFDIAICDCQAGQFYRRVGPDVVRDRFSLTDDNQVAYRELFDGEEPADLPMQHLPDDAIARAARTRKGAKL